MSKNSALDGFDPVLAQSAGDSERASDGRFRGTGKAGGRPSKGRREKHGFGALRRLAVHAMARLEYDQPITPEELDGRTRVAKALAELRRDMIEELGGPEALTPQLEQLIGYIVHDQLVLGSLDAFVVSMVASGKVIDRDKHGRLSVAPFLRERFYFADSATRRLQALGIERRPKPKEDLIGYMAAKYSEQREAETQDEPAEVVDETTAAPVDDAAAEDDGDPEP